LLDRHEACKTLTVIERADAQGLIDIAECFAVAIARRNQFAATRIQICNRSFHAFN
jgi:hypothetical protein